MYLQQFVLMLLLLAASSRCAKILGIFNIASISHQIVFQPIWKELSLRGHQVVVVTPNPLNDPTLVNLTEISIEFLYNRLEDFKQDLSGGMDHWKMMDAVIPFLIDNNKQILSHNEVNSLIESNETFDVVLVEANFASFAAFAAKYKCPVVGIASMAITNHMHQILGSPTHPTLYPDVTSSYTNEMTLLEKVDAVLFDIWYRYKYSYELMPALDEIIKQYFGNETPNLKELEKSISIVLLNTNPILHKRRPYGPNIIDMEGRVHIKQQKPLPSELNELLVNSTQGIIYFSLGSNVKSTYIPEEKRKIILEVFAELPYQVLWKFENDELKDRPENVKISKWFPQQDLLGHPNVKLFITQAGLQSLEEAIVRETPLLAIPFIGDQFDNALKIKTLGIGLSLNSQSLDKVSFKSAILEIINNSSFKENIIKLKKVLQDEPMTGLEKAVWWIEYVIRNKGAPYLKNPAMDVPWHEFLLLDVFLFFVTILAVCSYIILKIVRFAYKTTQRLIKSKRD